MYNILKSLSKVYINLRDMDYKTQFWVFGGLIALMTIGEYLYSHGYFKGLF